MWIAGTDIFHLDFHLDFYLEMTGLVIFNDYGCVFYYTSHEF